MHSSPTAVAAGRGQGAYAYAPGASRGEGPKGGTVFFATGSIKKFCELCRGRNVHERTNYLHRTMHILDVISSVSRSSKCNKIVGS